MRILYAQMLVSKYHSPIKNKGTRAFRKKMIRAIGQKTQDDLEASSSAGK